MYGWEIGACARVKECVAGRRYGGGLDQGLEVAKLERVDFFVRV